jgi:DNA-directed RNA polymerase subunit M/transcription elongation factor TFIIS
MAWTSEQLESLYANVYGNRIVCPTCGGPCKLERSKQPNEFGQLECSKCNQSHDIAQRNDPLRDSFREYTDAERKAIIDADKRRLEPTCPIDGATMVVYAQRSLALNSQVRIRCPRCGGEVQFKRMYG